MIVLTQSPVGWSSSIVLGPSGAQCSLGLGPFGGFRLDPNYGELTRSGQKRSPFADQNQNPFVD